MYQPSAGSGVAGLREREAAGSDAAGFARWPGRIADSTETPTITAVTTTGAATSTETKRERRGLR
ncbi:hypothetical protein GCM10023191_042450 [Actinoallomurus oryzae]|uniref:Uncharacterized protein n=1 Tax=Actinoallomurus oryzae TaxID=502180 RepID=A0ABP8Q5Q0_9ACTN